MLLETLVMTAAIFIGLGVIALLVKFTGLDEDIQDIYTFEEDKNDE